MWPPAGPPPQAEGVLTNVRGSVLGDTAIFDGGGNTNAAVDATFSVAVISITSGYTQTIIKVLISLVSGNGFTDTARSQ